MKKNILHCINCRDSKLPFDKSSLVWTAQYIVLLSIPGELLQGNFHRKLSPHIETAPKEQFLSQQREPRPGN